MNYGTNQRTSRLVNIWVADLTLQKYLENSVKSIFLGTNCTNNILSRL